MKNMILVIMFFVFVLKNVRIVVCSDGGTGIRACLRCMARLKGSSPFLSTLIYMKLDSNKISGIDFVRFAATDGVQIQGWLSRCDSNIAVIHVHGMSGNGYENYFLDEQRKMFTRNNLTFFTIDTRGRGVISSFRTNENGNKLGGSCYEIFEESVHDVLGAIEYLKSVGKTKFILQGHSLGASKVVHSILSSHSDDVVSSILLAPTDMIGWAKTDSDHQNYLKKAEGLVSSGNGNELVGSGCWLDKTPISAKTYLSICGSGGAVDIYNEKPTGPSLRKIIIPTLIVYGDQDIGILEIDKNINNWVKRVEAFNNVKIGISVIPGCDHGFRGKEVEVSNIIEEFVKKFI